MAGDAGVLGARLREEVRATAPLVRVTSITSQAALPLATLLVAALAAAAVPAWRAARVDPVIALRSE